MWDPQLLFEYNVEPADYESEAKPIQDVNKDSVVSFLLIFMKYVLQGRCCSRRLY